MMKPIPVKLPKPSATKQKNYELKMQGNYIIMDLAGDDDADLERVAAAQENAKRQTFMERLVGVRNAQCEHQLSQAYERIDRQLLRTTTNIAASTHKERYHYRMLQLDRKQMEMEHRKQEDPSMGITYDEKILLNSANYMKYDPDNSFYLDKKLASPVRQKTKALVTPLVLKVRDILDKKDGKKQRKVKSGYESLHPQDVLMVEGRITDEQSESALDQVFMANQVCVKSPSPTEQAAPESPTIRTQNINFLSVGQLQPTDQDESRRPKPVKPHKQTRVRHKRKLKDHEGKKRQSKSTNNNAQLDESMTSGIMRQQSVMSKHSVIKSAEQDGKPSRAEIKEMMISWSNQNKGHRDEASHAVDPLALERTKSLILRSQAAADREPITTSRLHKEQEKLDVKVNTFLENIQKMSPHAAYIPPQKPDSAHNHSRGDISTQKVGKSVTKKHDGLSMSSGKFGVPGHTAFRATQQHPTHRLRRILKGLLNSQSTAQRIEYERAKATLNRLPEVEDNDDLL